MRCAEQPNLLIRRRYWPGPDWLGQVLWNSDGVTYRHGTANPNISNLVFRAGDLRQSLPCLKANSG